MAFGSLLITTNATPAVLNPVLAARASSTPSAAPAAASPVAQGTPSATQSSANTSVRARPAVAGGARGGGGGAAAAASGATALLETAIAYSTTVGGKQYSGSVEQSDGAYTASIPNLAGATATGASAQAAENNLDARIDELV